MEGLAGVTRKALLMLVCVMCWQQACRAGQCFDVGQLADWGIANSQLTEARKMFLSSSRRERARLFEDKSVRCELVKGPPEAYAGTFNFRDIGGKIGLDGSVVRTGLLFRSARFDDIAEEGRAGIVGGLGVRTDLDLRHAGEVNHLGGESPLGKNVRWVHRTMCAYDAIDTREGRALTREALKVVFDKSGWPLAFHCKTGKDRTGTIAFLVLALLGVDEEVICIDWELTAFCVPEIERMSHPPRYDKMLACVNAMPGKSLTDKVEGYVYSLGFSHAQIESFRKAMLGPGKRANGASLRQVSSP